MGYPSVFPTGTLIYNKEKAFNGYTLYPSKKGALLIDMNGNEVKLWAGLGGFPNKLLPGGQVFGTTGARKSKLAYQDQLDLVQVDWDGHIVWKFDHTELIQDPGKEPSYQARQHHDFQREGSSTGYYAPGSEPYTDRGNTLILTHENLYNHDISDKVLIDDKIIEVDWEGNIFWSWRASDHFEELGFDEAAKNALYRNPGMHGEAGGDWMHINSISTLGPNRFYDNGDSRFAPDNIIFDARNSNILGIIDKETGKVVYRLGPDFSLSPELRKLGWIIGQHHFHMTPLEAGFFLFTDASKFYSSYISSAQRLPNGNTLITEGSDGRLIEVTPEHEIVWEFINPYFNTMFDHYQNNMVYRAYRVPYEWVPQLEKPVEKSIEPLNVETFRIPGAGTVIADRTIVDGVNPDAKRMTGGGDSEEEERVDFCVASVEKKDLK